MSGTAAFAKVDPPRLHDTLSRERLFRKLDFDRRRPITWIAAQAGAGKTTLVADFLESRDIPAVWYQMDRGDADPATFFHYLRFACERAAPRLRDPHAALPLLTPDYFPDLPLFARRCFRELFRAMGDGTCLVLDNLQDVPTESALHACLGEALMEVPDGVQVILISRSEPFGHYVRLVANAMSSVLGWNDLKLTEAEIKAIAQRNRIGADALVRQLIRYSDGWAAGLVLMIEHCRRNAGVDNLATHEGLKGVFQYLGVLVFDQLPAADQRTLLLASFFPILVPRLLRALCGAQDAGRLLNDLYERHLFTDRRRVGSAASALPEEALDSDEEPFQYQFHALFHAFLQDLARSRLPPPECRAIAVSAAELLEQDGMVEQAVPLYLRGQAWRRARDSLCRLAAPLIESGRASAVLQWLAAFPRDVLETDAWLLYHDGAARVGLDAHAGRARLERAYEVACSADARSPCALLAAAAIMQSHFFDYRDMTPLRRWLGVVDGWSPAIFGGQLEPDVEYRVIKSMLFAMTYYDPSHAMLDQVAERAWHLAQRAGDINLRMQLLTQFAMFGAQLGHVQAMTRAIPMLEGLVGNTAITPLNRVMGYRAIAWACHTIPDFARGAAAAHAAIALAECAGIPYAKKVPTGLGLLLELMRGNLSGGRDLLDRLEHLVDSHAVWDRALLLGMHTYYGIFAGDVEHAARHAEAAVEEVEKCGVALYRILYRHILSWVHIEQGRLEDARRRVQEARELCRVSKIAWPLAWVHTHLAELARRSADEAAFDRHVKALFFHGQQSGCGAWFTVWGRWMPRLCEHALRHRHAEDYVKSLIRRYGWRPETEGFDEWPWDIRIHALGEFKLRIKDQEPRFGRKAPRKPLMLLKALIGLGATQVPQQALCDACWPDLEGDAAVHTLTVTLVRLREMLGERDSIRLQDGLVSLNRKLCWVDTLSFERWSEALLEAVQSGDDGTVDALARRCRSLYGGSLLKATEDEAWIIAPRERLRSRFVRLMEAVGARHERHERWDACIDWYAYGIELEPLAESLYQGVMRACLGACRHSEGLAVYQRLTRTLSVTLGGRPSAGSVKLHGMLAAGA